MHALSLAALHVLVDQMPSDAPGVLDYLPVVTAGIAALSAGLSLVSVRQARHLADRALLPNLHVSTTLDAARRLQIAVGNASKAMAPDTGWAAWCGGARAEGQLEKPFLTPDGVEWVSTQLPVARDAEPVALAWCRDHQGALRVWASDGRSVVLRPGRGQSVRPVDLLIRFCGERAGDAADLTREPVVGPLLR